MKLRTISRAKYLQGVSAVSASDVPVTGLYSRSSFSINSRIFRNFRYPFCLEWMECTPWLRQQNCGQFLEQSFCRGPPVVLLSHPRGGLQQIGIGGAARAECAGAAGVLGFVEGGRSGPDMADAPDEGLERI